MIKDENLYLVGGIVRDEILNKVSVDTDYCYIGNAIEFVDKKLENAKIIRTNLSFGTVKVKTDGEEIDIASTRTETYPKPGHLPKVERIGCSLKEDMVRRDFTINAMAKRTTDGDLVDYFGGIDDIEAKRLRVLHKNSFVDDPTRIIRGLKFSVRFGFELSNDTMDLQRRYLSNINYDMSYHRLKQELKDAFSLNRSEVMERFIEQGLYKLLGENQNLPSINPKDVERIIKEYPCEHSWLIYLSYFNLSNIPLTRAEKRILEWKERLKNQEPTNNTPMESLLIQKLEEI